MNKQGMKGIAAGFEEGIMPSWKTIRLKFLADWHKGKQPPEDAISSVESDSSLPYLSMEFLRREVNGSAIYVLPRGNSVIANDGDIILLWDGSNAGEFLLAKRGLVSSTSAVLRSRALDRRFLYYACKSVESRLQEETVGMGIPHVSGEILGRMPIGCPPSDEQIRTAEYLDETTKKIDRLIALRQQQMSLLRQRQIAQIQQVVQRGLSSTVGLKDSGIPEIGGIPIHWRILRIAIATSKVANGYVGPTRDILCARGVRYIQSLHVKDGHILFDSPYYVTKEWSDAHPRSILRAGDVLVVQTGGCTGQFALVPDEFQGANCHALIILRMKPQYGSGPYLSLLLSSSYGQACLMRERTGALHPHLECGKVRDIRLPFPPPEEQEEILSFLRLENDKADRLLGFITRQLQLLTEYRKALIHECVTGQRGIM